MHVNPVLNKLGFSDQDRLVIIHADDVGMCQASLSAFTDLMEFGLVSSGATMVPCPWFPAVVSYCREYPKTDMGVHLTLNSEWDNYRWAPISTCDPASGLLDDEGYFHHWQAEAQENADPAAVQLEIQAQVARALSAGINVTHIDTHMGTVAHPKFIPAYLQLALQHHLPPMIPRLDEAGYLDLGMDADAAAMAVQWVQSLEEQGIPLLDHLAHLDLDEPGERLEQAKQTLDACPPGITHFIIHPSKDTPELRAITPDWRCRVADYETFMIEEMRAYIRQSGFQVIGYQVLRDLWREQ